jgi:BMFP domain-containing protein YqiC
VRIGVIGIPRLHGSDRANSGNIRKNSVLEKPAGIASWSTAGFQTFTCTRNVQGFGVLHPAGAKRPRTAPVCRPCRGGAYFRSMNGSESSNAGNGNPEFEDCLREVLKLLPEDLRRSREELESNLRTVLSAAFARMDLVTREEFDIQSALLSRTRAMLDELERKVSELETTLAERER